MNKKYRYPVIIFLIVSSFIAFSPITGNDFINLDDHEYILENTPIQSGLDAQSIEWAFTSVVRGNWHPLTMLSHMLDWIMFGANPSGHHLVSLLWHIGSVVLLFLFLMKTTNHLWSSAFAAAFFALHPLRVESVAWASERKDVLSMFFGMACLYGYAFYAKAPKLSGYLLCLILFAAALMSKPMMVTLPFILLLLDYWPLNRFHNTTHEPGKNRLNTAGKLLLEKIPFILLTAVLCIITLYAQHKDKLLTSFDHLPFLPRFMNAVVAFAAYPEKTFWPCNLAVFYPFELSLPLWKVIMSGVLIITITFAVLYYIRKLPFLFVGWFWYLGTLVPVIGLVQVANQAMADRYTYLPSIGIAVALAWSIPLLFPQKQLRKKILLPAATVILAVIIVLTWNQCGYWKNSITLYNHALRVTRNNHLAYNSLGVIYYREGKIKEALYYYDKAIRIVPDLYQYYMNRGNAYARTGRYPLAIDDYSKVIFLNPGYVQAYNNRGNAFSNAGSYQQAVENYNEAVRMKPDYADAYNNRALVYLNHGNKISGCIDAQKACELGNCRTLNMAKNNGYCP